MPRPYTDIQSAISGAVIKNGSVVTSTTFTGNYNTLNTYTKNTPTVETISSKYGNNFYNAPWVTIGVSGNINNN